MIEFMSVLGNVRSPLDLSEEEWNRVLRTNLTGTWLVSKSVCKRMRDAGRGGSVINISSITGVSRGQLPGAAAYASSKAGLNTLTKVLSPDFAIDLNFIVDLPCHFGNKLIISGKGIIASLCIYLAWSLNLCKDEEDDKMRPKKEKLKRSSYEESENKESLFEIQ